MVREFSCLSEFVLVVKLIVLITPCIKGNCNYVITKQNDVEFNSSQQTIHKTKGLQQCLKECSVRAGCLSVNFDKSTLTCTLQTESASSTGGHTDEAPGMVYLERDQWDQAIAGPCNDTVCPTNSLCVALSSGQTSCVAFECPDPIVYYNSYITTPEVSKGFGSTIEYACPTGYVWVGGVVTCSLSGSWQGANQVEGCLVFASDDHCVDDDAVCSHITSARCKAGVCVCQDGYSFITETSRCIKDCKSLFTAGNKTNGAYEIAPDGINSITTFCDMDNGGWTVFERRYVGDVNFMRDWADYRFSFGLPDGDFWLGLEYLNALTMSDSDVYFDFITTSDQPYFALYHNFSVADNSSLYKLSLSSNFDMTPEYNNIRNGGFYDHNNMFFSTPDMDNDISSSNCATTRGAWWWNKCYTFGLFLNNFNDMRMYMGFNNTYIYFKNTTMKVRRTK
ncbi:uncharacterized protein LOC132547805 [Ylistrum balloti]|uniref:uncharacterized protein LOC132547805 n=1 Tax=Ylistrum balloti TaxID=509963 RepID=UPI0029058EB7|nr:uncharacterized protein LOC132547805 [Ylistrum balloti]